MSKEKKIVFDPSNIKYHSEALHMQRSFEGVWFPAGLWLLKNLTWTEKIVLLEIDSLDKGNGCFASDVYLAGFAEVSKSRLSHIITDLRKKGWLKTVSFDGRKRYIKLNDKVHEAIHRKVNSIAADDKADLSYTTYSIAADDKAQNEKNCITSEQTKTCKQSDRTRVLERDLEKKDNSRSEQAPSRKRTISETGILHDKASPTLFPQKRTIRQSKVLSDKDIKQQRIAMKVATKLKFALAHHKWITWTPNLEKWVKDIIKLRKSDLVKVTFKDMFIAVRYLKDHGEEQWCPKVCNASQFGSKYGSILDAIQRTNGEKVIVKSDQNSGSFDCPEAELIPQNLRKGVKCSHCKSNSVKVYEVLPPDGSFNTVKICKKCYRKWQKQIEEDQQYDDIE